MATLVQLQTWLSEAEEARHKLAIGKRAVTIRDQTGRNITYTDTTIAQLDAYIALLQGQIAAASGTPRPKTFLPVTGSGY